MSATANKTRALQKQPRYRREGRCGYVTSPRQNGRFDSGKKGKRRWIQESRMNARSSARLCCGSVEVLDVRGSPQHESELEL